MAAEKSGGLERYFVAIKRAAWGGPFYTFSFDLVMQLSWPSCVPPSAFSSSPKCGAWQLRLSDGGGVYHDRQFRAAHVATLVEQK